MEAPSQHHPGKPRPPPGRGHWVELLSARVNAYRADLESAATGNPPDERLTGAQIFRGQGLVYDQNPNLAQAQELQELRFGGALAASFIPQRHIGYVSGRPVMVFCVDS